MGGCRVQIVVSLPTGIQPRDRIAMKRSSGGITHRRPAPGTLSAYSALPSSLALMVSVRPADPVWVPIWKISCAVPVCKR